MSASNYLENEIGDLILGASTWTPPATVFIQLHIADPGEGGNPTTSVVTGTGYAALEADNDKTTWSDAVSGVITNDIEFDFGVVGAGGWSSGGNITHATICDGDTSGDHILLIGTLTVPKPALAGDEVKFPPGSITFTVT